MRPNFEPRFDRMKTGGCLLVRQRNRGDLQSPILLLGIMILKEKIETLANGFLSETDKYIMNIDVKPGNLIIVTIEGDSGVTIDDCMQLSRSIEGSLDRDEEDFELRVRSYGAESPLVLPPQYTKHVGRELDITLQDDRKTQGKLVAVQDEMIELHQKQKGGKKTEGLESTFVKFDEIKEARIIISFK